MSIRAYAASGAGELFQTIEYDPGELGPAEVEVAVDYCGLCHSDLSMWGNDWGISSFPFVGGHEISGRVVAKGEQVRSLELGARVGVGWYAGSCETCEQCLSGNQHLCPTSDQTIVGRHGGFAERVRCDALWATPLPEGLDPAAVGPLFCGGITVFSPIVISNVSPMDRVGVVGIGGLGHMAI
ncbi:MAG: alcohol dehydrogenase catalytic domain-containing protein, partial [Verrucomicrobiota bacterium]